MNFQFIYRNVAASLRTGIINKPLQHNGTSPFFHLLRSVSITTNPPITVAKTRTKKKRVFSALILTVLKSQGYSDEHIERLIRRHPLGLNGDAKVLEQTLVYFREMGFSRTDIVVLLLSMPQIMRMDVNNQIVRNFKMLLPIVGSKDDIFKTALKKPALILRSIAIDGECDSQASICSILKSHGFSDEHIKIIVLKYPKVLNVDITKSQIMPNLNALALIAKSKDDIVKAVLKTPNLIIGNTALTVSLLKSYGFSEESIKKLFRKCPSVFARKNKTLEEKLVYFREMGFSSTATGTLFSSDPQILRTSIKNRINPNLAILGSMLGSKDKVVKAVLKVPRVIMNDLNSTLLPNIEILKKNGLGGDMFSDFLNIKSRILFRKPALLEKWIGLVNGLGFDIMSERYKIVAALGVLGSNSTDSLERKTKMLMSLGFTDNDVITLFKNSPYVLEVGDDTMRERVKFFMDKLHFSPSVIAAHPILLTLSLKRRIIPRCAVFNLLVSRGIKKMKMREIVLFVVSDEKFVNTYVRRYLNELPELTDALEGKVKFEGLELSCYGQPNLENLRDHFVPRTSVMKLIKKYPNVIKVNPSHLVSVVRGLKTLGFDFSSDKFVDALGILGALSDQTSKMKFSLYRSFGWSEDDIHTALVNQPLFVGVPDREIERKVHVLRDRFGWTPLQISQNPTILLLDLEKCIIPRCSVFKLLVSAKTTGIKDHPQESFLTMSDRRFFKTYINKFQNKVPQLLELYQRLI